MNSQLQPTLLIRSTSLTKAYLYSWVPSACRFQRDYPVTKPKLNTTLRLKNCYCNKQLWNVYSFLDFLFEFSCGGWWVTELMVIFPGGRREHGPLLLAEAGGHDHLAAGLQDRPQQPRFGPRRGNRRRHGRRLHRLPPLQPFLFQWAPRPCPSGFYALSSLLSVFGGPNLVGPDWVRAGPLCVDE